MGHRLLLFLFLIGFSACNNDSFQTGQTQSNKTNESGKAGDSDGTATVCIWDRAVLRTLPSLDNGKWISSVALGEKVSWLNETYIDSSDNNREFLKIRLSDGKEGWTLAYVLVRNAKPAAVTQKIQVYRRPDILTITDKVIEPMEMVAITKFDANGWR